MTVPSRTWGIYASRVYELNQRKGVKVYDRNRFEEHVAVDGMRRLAEQAEGWLRMFPGLSPQRLAEALVDGQPPRYVERAA